MSPPQKHATSVCIVPTSKGDLEHLCDRFYTCIVFHCKDIHFVTFIIKMYD